MITSLYALLRRGVEYLREHAHLILVLLLLILIPLLFLYSGQKFLDLGRANQDRLQKDRIGILHDVFSSLVVASDFDIPLIQNEMDRLASLNHDIRDFRLVSIKDGVVSPVAALDREVIGTLEPFVDMFLNATVDLNRTMISPVLTDSGRLWFTYRAINKADGEFFVAHTVTSLETIDELFTQRERQAYLSLSYIFALILILVYWHLRMTDYKYLYLREVEKNASKDTFINMVAHELRAPLTAIKGYAELLSDTITTPAEHQHLLRIQLSAKRLIEMVTDLLDVSRIQSGSLTVNHEFVNVSAIVQQVISEIEVSAREKGIELTSVGAETPHEAVGDPVRIHQVLINLVNNAIKYTEQGSITLELKPKRNSLEIRIKDTGIGIEADDQRKLFAPFFRVHSTDVSAIAGSGLGMWITKQLVMIMGGSIGIESIRGIGTHIVVTLKTSAPNEKEALRNQS